MNNGNRIAVVGGGASGMAAAIAAARAGAKVCLFEAQSRVGRKLLSTGNGRCNISNSSITPAHYRSERLDKAAALLAALPPQEIMAFLRSLGIECFEEREGRLYPRSEQASAVLDMLRAELERLGVETLCERRIDKIIRGKNGFRLLCGAEEFTARRVIIACGSQAAPQLGGCNDALSLLRAHGHSSTKTAPALVPLEVESEHLKALKGVRSRCRLTLMCQGKRLATDEGELQFNESNLSGIVTMQLASHAARRQGECLLCADLMPDISAEALIALLTERQRILGHLGVDMFLAGLLNKRLATCLLKQAGVRECTRRASGLTVGELNGIVKTVKDWRFTVKGTLGYRHAQVMSGGIPLGEVTDRLESTKVPGLFLCGELLDCDGDCGGYNLHWAWCTGLTAGRAAAKITE